MRRIRKQAPPDRLTEWIQGEEPGWRPSYRALRNEKTVYAALVQALLSEQGHLCCYCQSRVTAPPEGGHVEHFRPQHLCGSGEDVDFANLFLSCPGHGREQDPMVEDRDLTQPEAERHPTAMHCGHKKGRWFDEQLLVSPTQEDCEEHFRYTSGGEILPTDEASHGQAARATILHLGLNHSTLRTRRRKVLEALLFDERALTQAELARFLESYLVRDAEGRLPEFPAVVRYLLSTYAGP